MHAGGYQKCIRSIGTDRGFDFLNNMLIDF